MVDHVLLAPFVLVHEFLALVFHKAHLQILVQVLGQETDIALEFRSFVSLAVYCDLGEKVKIHHITILVYLSNFKVMHFMDHRLELRHDLLHLLFILDTLLSKDALKMG